VKRDPFVMELPQQVIVGRGVLRELGEALQSRGFKDPLFVVGKYTSRFAEGDKLLVERPSKEFLDGVDVDGHDVIVGIGGGKNLDSAKYLSLKSGRPYVLVPTLPSSDGISSPSVSLFSSSGRISLIHRPPLFILMDEEVLSSAPKKYILSGYGDVIAKYSSLYDWWLGHVRTGEYYGYLTSRLGHFAIEHATSARTYLFTPEGVHVLLESLILSGGLIGIQRSSRPASGSEHLISHALDILHLREGRELVPHGIQTGIATVFTSYLQGRNWRWVRGVLDEANFPTTLREAGIDPDLFVDAVLLAPHLRRRHTILHEKKLNRHEVYKILQEVELI